MSISISKAIGDGTETRSKLHNKLPMYMINLVIIYVVVNGFSMKNHKSIRKLRVGVNRYTGVNWSTTTTYIDQVSVPSPIAIDILMDTMVRDRVPMYLFSV